MSDERLPYSIEFALFPEITAAEWAAYEEWLCRQSRDVLTIPPGPLVLPVPQVPWKPPPEVIERCRRHHERQVGRYEADHPPGEDA